MHDLVSRYNGGAHGWGNMECVCSRCGAVFSEEVCDSNGVPTGEYLFGSPEGDEAAMFEDCPCDPLYHED